MVQSETIPGIYVIPSSESSLLWYGVIFVRTGQYKGGIFRFNISLTEEFPNDLKPPVSCTVSQLFQDYSMTFSFRSSSSSKITFTIHWSIPSLDVWTSAVSFPNGNHLWITSGKS